MEALAGLYAARDESALAARLQRHIDNANGLWRPYWQSLWDGLCPESPLVRWCEVPEHQANYEVATVLAAPLACPCGQELAKAVIRRLAPEYWRLPLWKMRIVRTLGRGLDPREDADAARLLVQLHERWDVDQKSRGMFVETLDRAGFEAARAALEWHLFAAGALNSQRTALRLLGGHPQAEATALLRRGIQESDLPGDCALICAERRDQGALPHIDTRLKRRDDGAVAEVQRLHLRIAERALRGDGSQVAAMLKRHCAVVSLPLVLPLVERAPVAEAAALLVDITLRFPTMSAIEALGRLGPVGRRELERLRASMMALLPKGTLLRALAEPMAPDKVLDAIERRIEAGCPSLDAPWPSLDDATGPYLPAHIPRLANLLRWHAYAPQAASTLARIGTSEALARLEEAAVDPDLAGRSEAQVALWSRDYPGTA